MPIILALTAVFCVMVLLYVLLYYFGILTINNKTAVKFIADGSSDGRYFHAVIKGCKGSIKKIIRFKSEGEITVKLNTDLTFGKVSVSLKELKTKESLLITREPKHNYCAENNEAILFNKAKVPYSLTLNFENCDGEFWLYIKNEKADRQETSTEKV